MSPIHRNEGEISAIGRAAELLKEFLHGDGRLTAAALVRRTGLPKSTVYRLLAELVRVGLLEQDGGIFRPGLLMFELGQAAPVQRGLHEAAHPYMADLHQATGHNVGVATLLGTEVVYIDILRGKDAPRLPQRTGSRWPAHASCSGKAMLAFADIATVRSVLEGGLARLTDATILEPQALRDELARVRRRGAAFDRGESFTTVTGVASPVFGPDNEVVGSLSVSGLRGRINLTRVEAAVRTAALSVSRELTLAPSVGRPAFAR